MTYFELPNRYSANIQEGTFTSSFGFDYRFKVSIKNVCGEIEETAYCPTLADAMELLAQY